MSKWTSIYDDVKKANYAFSGNQWVGYDDAKTLATKCQYINDKNLGGGMIWSIDTDDVLGECGAGTYPLLKVISNALMGGAAPTTTTQKVIC